MPDKKLTDNEIIKALECCIIQCSVCKQCPLLPIKDNRGKCYTNLKKQALDLINRLQEKNSNLTSDLTSLRNDLTSLQAENERLIAECGNQSTLWSKHFESIFETAKETVKAEAYKECIEKVKALFPSYNEPYQYWEIHEGADNLLKELVGEDNADVQ